MRLKNSIRNIHSKTLFHPHPPSKLLQRVALLLLAVLLGSLLFSCTSKELLLSNVTDGLISALALSLAFVGTAFGGGPPIQRVARCSQRHSQLFFIPRLFTG